MYIAAMKRVEQDGRIGLEIYEPVERRGATDEKILSLLKENGFDLGLLTTWYVPVSDLSDWVADGKPWGEHPQALAIYDAVSGYVERFVDPS